MALPSLADALIVIILLIPGFITFSIIRWLGHYGSKLSEFNITITSFSLSMVILFFYTQIIGVTDVDVLRDKFFVRENYLILFGITLAVGVSIGIILKRGRTNYNRTDTWQKIITKYENSSWILVFTKNGQEYKGALVSVGVELDQSRDLAIVFPKQIIRNEKQEIVSEIEVGYQMLFKDEDILRVSFLQSSEEVNRK